MHVAMAAAVAVARGVEGDTNCSKIDEIDDSTLHRHLSSDRLFCDICVL